MSITILVALLGLPTCTGGRQRCATHPGAPVRATAAFGSVEEWVDTFVASIPRRLQQPYNEPRGCEEDAFLEAVRSARAGDLQRAASAISPLGYDVYRFEDGKGVSAVFAEKDPGARRPYEHGWGLYFVGVGPRPSDGLLVEAPHPIDDLHSHLVAAHAYQVAGAAFLGVAGAEREVNGHPDADDCRAHRDCSDMSHQPRSVFQSAHRGALSMSSGGAQVYQSHGYAASLHPDLAGRTAVSAGTPTVTQLSSQVAAELSERDFAVCLVGRPTNERCSDLAALKNVQGESTRPANEFIHVEAPLSVREDPVRRRLLAEAVVCAMSPVASCVTKAPAAGA